MKDKSVIILCAGKATRFNGTVKQLLRIGRTTILERIVEQCLARGQTPIVAARHNQIADAARTYGAEVAFPENYGVTCETFINMRDYFGKHTCILLGDVIYSPQCINRILWCKHDFRFFGNHFEVFGFHFSHLITDKVISAAKDASHFKLGKLRYLYRRYIGVDMDIKEVEGKPLDDNFVYINDWTNDIDSHTEYVNAIREVVTQGLLKNV
jgi:hypothetical protein